MRDVAATNDRDRYWLEHHESQVASGLSAKEYAEGQGISVQALYQARKRLRTRGMIAATRLVSVARRRAPRFSKVALAPAAPIEPPRFRIELANGAVLEWSGAASVEPVADLVERMARLP